ncbi:Phosphoinositide phosphatase [Komagataella phaffii CBS 7435]|uniref:Phosphatidylinositol (PI) phosphatase n=2 Tax=Komagataella phaffii TaxID=460519 RepID=C4QZ02_KOMPG|nr:Phosphatidylinositol (PI) phosphatase [Komagataella phaffii GS115]AOA60638.1 GQ67_01522T0 [Komagataella phaffii]CAH2447302.1 Phosphoinositide phosphatase [Komagataella phaffii CBS 7435]AOA66020.1 GQ68_01538T0 [Komagataella phaffii GS115]CAY68476.1 Phosphatidylinositol (PI) phosphatase [Komagataella phaffii GS115]CCA37541.1 Phosphoinositide phosphatase [Komagataella phaffii CBS 7435]
MSEPLILGESGKDYVVYKASSDDTAIRFTVSGLSVEKKSDIKSSTQELRSIAGIVGVLRLSSNTYLVTIDGGSECGTIKGSKVYRMVGFSFWPISHKVQVEDDAKYLELVRGHLKNASLYFSYGYDLTNSMQRQTLNGDSDGLLGPDERFFWNRFLSEPLISLSKEYSQVKSFVLPLIYGYANVISTSINGSPVSFGLITRRSTQRAGTRYFRRGIDSQGHAANFNETEQILIVPEGTKTHYFSFLQTRGSVPVSWAEVNNLRYKPSLFIGTSNLPSTRLHFDEQISEYGTNYLVNLVDQKGYELPVKNAYEGAVNNLGDSSLKYIYFDFHHRCRKMQWHNVKLLLGELAQLGFSTDDYFHAIVDDGKLSVVKKQSSVIRTNCMDCLDRTNVVQSMISRSVLQSQLASSHVVKEIEQWEQDKAFNFEFQNFWADNADAVSLSYSGTGALKTDYTRTGKRTTIGALYDLSNSITRYIKNNYKDGPRQDGYDLFLGNFLPYEAISSPFTDGRPLQVQYAPYVLIVSLSLFALTLFYPRGPLFAWHNLKFLGLCLTFGGLSGLYIVKNGYQYVNWPQLCDLDYLVKQRKGNNYLFEKNPDFGDANVLKKD